MRWGRPFEGTAGLLLLVAVLLLGALFGLSLAVITRTITGETLLGLWGPALGASIGATATLSAAIYNQHRAERRELRPEVRALEKTINKVHGDVATLAARVASHQAYEQSRLMPALRDLTMQFSLVASNIHIMIEPADRLPLDLVREIVAARNRGARALLESVEHAKRAFVLKGDDSTKEFGLAATYIERAQRELSGLYRHLRRWVD